MIILEIYAIQKHTFAMLTRMSMVAVIFVPIVLSGMSVAVGQSPSSLPIEGARDMSFDQIRSTAYVLNSDGTLSAYNVAEKKFLFSRVSSPGALDPLQILASPAPNDADATIAIFHRVGFQQYGVAFYRVSNDGLTAGPSYVLEERLASGKTGMEFSADGKTLFVNYGERGLYILSVGAPKQDKVTVGTFPRAIAMDDDGRVLVVNGKSEDLSIVDPVRKTVQATVKLGSDPRVIIFNKVNQRAYISHVGSDDVYVVDTAAARVVQVVKVGNDPAALAYDETSGAVFVANNSSGMISVISPDFTVRTVELGSAAYFASSPILLAYLNNEKKLFILNGSEAKYFVYDVAQARIVKSESTDESPFRLFTSEKTKSALILHWSANSFFIVDAGTLRSDHVPESTTTAGQFFSKPQSVAVDSKTNRIFVSNLGSDYITVIDGSTQKPMAKVVAGRSIQNLFLNTETRKLYAVSPPDNTVIVVNIARNDYPTKTVRLAQQPRGGAINEKTNRIYYSNAAVAKMSVVDGANDEVVATIDLPLSSFPLVNAVDEGRNKIYTALYGGNSIAVIDGDSNQVEKFISVGANPIWVRYLPSLDRVFVSVEGEKRVLVINPDTDAIIQSIAVSGKPYRIFFDAGTNYVYINHRDENSVTILAPAAPSGAFKVVAERSNMLYWGQTDARPYNMLIYNDQTNLMYLTAGKYDSVDVVRVARDAENILQGTWYATLSADGTVRYSQEAQEEVSAKRNLIYFGIAAAVLLAAFAAIFFRHRRQLAS